MQPNINNAIGPAAPNLGFAGWAAVIAWAARNGQLQWLQNEYRADRDFQQHLRDYYARNADQAWVNNREFVGTLSGPTPTPRPSPSPSAAPSAAFHAAGTIASDGTLPKERKPWSKEWKSIQFGYNTSAANIAAPYIENINGVSQGTNYTQRVGRKITMKHVIVQGHIDALFSSGEYFTPRAQIMVIYDKQNNGSGAVPDKSAIWDASYNISTFWVDRPLNLTNSARFVVLAKESFDFYHCYKPTNDDSATAPLGERKYFRLGFYCNLDAIYKGTTNSLNDITTGSLLFVFLCDTSFYCNVYWLSRVRFTD